jgi:hypothetical protein
MANAGPHIADRGGNAAFMGLGTLAGTFPVAAQAGVMRNLPGGCRDEAPPERGFSLSRHGFDQDQFAAARLAGSGISIGPDLGVPIRRGLPNGSRRPQSVP